MTPLLTVTINAPALSEPIPEQQLQDVLDFCYRATMKRKKPARADLLIANDAEMIKLNRRHLGKNEPTDVLAFEDGEMEDGALRLGDIAIGLDVATRESAARGIARDHELIFYALHGLLHLLGMDDAADADRARMHRTQAKAMEHFGLPAAKNYLHLWENTEQEEQDEQGDQTE